MRLAVRLSMSLFCAVAVCVAQANSSETPAIKFVEVSPGEFARRVTDGSIVLSGAGKVRLGSPLLPFIFQDLRGRRWTEADLKGKITIVSFWASWCKPCIEELAGIERLHRTLDSSPAIQLVTFNVDPRGSQASRRLGAKFSFPTILAGEDYLKRMSESDSIAVPRVWIVDRGGAIVREHTGALADPAKWVDEQLAALRIKR